MSTIVVPNNRGTEDVHVLVGGTHGVVIAKAIEDAFAQVLKTQMRREEFSGHIQIIVLATTPASERKFIAPVTKQLRALCAELSTKEGPYDVTLTFARDTNAPEPGQEAVAAKSASIFAALRSPAVRRKIVWLGAGIAVAAILYVGTRAILNPFPRSILFGRQLVNKATDWDKGQMSGVVYVLPGESLPTASLQVGVIISGDYPTAEQLDGWIRTEYIKAAGAPYYESDNGSDACKIGAYKAGEETRVFLSLTACKTGAKSATCVEADEPLAPGIVEACKRQSACFDDVCARRWEARREPLDALASRFLSK